MSPMPKKRADRHLEIDTVHKGIEDIFDKYGWWWWKPKSSMFGKVGISDYHAGRKNEGGGGLFMVVEAKRGAEVGKIIKYAPTANQISFLQRMRDTGFWAFVVNETRLKHLDAFLGSFEIATQAAQKKQEVPKEHGAQMVNCLREMQQEI